MNDKELADRIVALGVGKAHQVYPDALGRFYQADLSADWQTAVSPDEFVCDWRVAGAMMEKAQADGLCIESGTFFGMPEAPLPRFWCEIRELAFTRDDSLPRAINLVCVEALKGNDDV